MNSVNEKAEKIYRWMQYISCVLLVAMMAVLILNIVLRALFSKPLYGTFEAVSYLSMLVVIFALAINEYKDGNLTVDMILEYMRPKSRNVLEIFNDFVSIAMCVIMTYQSFLLTFSKYAKGDLTPNLYIPQWILVLCLSVGFVVLTLCLVLKVITKIINHKYMSNEKIVKDKEEGLKVDVGSI